ncbi:UV-damaged DNA-binding protein rad7 [Coemansia sp. RSA 532]|nr:UV-damaged DNA-binding protein rad7 [Coemansia sp. RSA 532]KAJ2198383.1 UV-damaged DNA-binding protein rad7 [Coemansia sp. RSA 522]KAJ2276446.1 UV-damaged DNA-binding protein rad7 [Coemansia sp. RSA 371]KAJ2282245.1 UV-damaged DNA-binding protein rad7 [Coemansia sp. RSA 370]KAJ2294831.1 UV-damaged DNA-binding protein rad7 [Coemansia sp. RSA 355]
MDPNDRARGNAAGRAGGRSKGAGIRGPSSALTDYLQEIGVTEHFRERRRREAEERAAAEQGGQQGQQQGEQQQQVNAEAGNADEEGAETENAEPDHEETQDVEEETADSALAADMQHAEDQAQEAGPSTVTVQIKAKGKGKRKKDEESDYEPEDEMTVRGGLNRSSARKGGRMHDCDMCGKRFLVRGEMPDQLLCAACRRSKDKASAADAASVARRARTVQKKPAARHKMRKTEGGLLEFEAELPTLQNLCVRAIARHLDQVDSFGEVSGPSLDRLNRIISKLRVLDAQTMRLFMGADRTSVTLYDCTRIDAAGLRRISDECPMLERLDLQFCGRMDGASLLALAQGLPKLQHVRLDGAFLVRDTEWAAFFREAGGRLRSFSAAFAGFGPQAMRALVTHCVNIESLRLAECSDFDDDCLAMLAVPITEYEEAEQEAERKLRAETGKGKQAVGTVLSWQPLAQLRVLELQRPHKPMVCTTARRVVRALGAQLRVLDMSGFRDLDDGFMGDMGDHATSLQELALASCDSITGDAMAAFFARRNGFTRVDLGRCYMLTDNAVQELVRHSGATLRHLSLNSVDDSLTQNGLLALAGQMFEQCTSGKEPRLAEQTLGCVGLEVLDVSWVRSTTDNVLETVVSQCKRLASISVYGCGSVSAFAPVRPGLKYVGRECDTL